MNALPPGERPPAAADGGQPDSAGRIDWQRFRGVAADCDWSDAELTRFYVEGVREQLDEMLAAVAADEAKTLKRLAHGARGFSDTCGLLGMSEMFQTLEQCADTGQLQGGADLLARSRRRLDAIERKLHERIAEA